ncbi:MAG: M15 family metallopeptidase [Burkholderiaceae bacterium]
MELTLDATAPIAGGQLPAGFSRLRDACPSALIDPRYATDRNFIGRPLDGYESAQCCSTTRAALALRAVCEEAARAGLAVKVFDAYRPERAVRDMVRWCGQAEEDPEARRLYHPRIPKRELLQRGYIAPASSHSRGSAIDLTLAVGAAGLGAPDLQELDMGTPFDHFDPASACMSDEVSGRARENRLLLRRLMTAGGFVPYELEWWHFRLADEPFRTQSFDFPIP